MIGVCIGCRLHRERLVSLSEERLNPDNTVKWRYWSHYLSRVGLQVLVQEWFDPDQYFEITLYFPEAGEQKCRPGESSC